jgi:hypothetical protein
MPSLPGCCGTLPRFMLRRMSIKHDRSVRHKKERRVSCIPQTLIYTCTTAFRYMDIQKLMSEKKRHLTPETSSKTEHARQSLRAVHFNRVIL